MKRRVAITGMGIISSVGSDVRGAWDNLIHGRSGIRRIEDFPCEDLSVQIAGTVQGFDVNRYLNAKEARRLDRFIHYGYAAAVDAITASGLDFSDEDLAERSGVVIGSGIGGLPGMLSGYKELLESGPRRVSPFYVPRNIINMVSGQVSITYGLKGPNFSVVTACASGTHSIGQAMRLIQYGDADVMIAGGTEASNCRMGLAGFAAAHALSHRNDDPEKASRPWDKERDGFVLAEGAGVLVLEEWQHALARGAEIYGEIIGFGMTSDAHHMTAPLLDGSGAKRCMLNTLKDAGIRPEEVNYINAHGTSTPAGDVAENIAIKAAFGDAATKIAISSSKSMTGHALGAAGGLEAIFTLLALREGLAPPTINLDHPDEGCDLNYVAHEAQARSMDIGMSNSFGFGGTNACLLFRRYH